MSFIASETTNEFDVLRNKVIRILSSEPNASSFLATVLEKINTAKLSQKRQINQKWVFHANFAKGWLSGTFLAPDGMAKNPDFNGTILEVENHEKNEKVIISLEI